MQVEALPSVKEVVSALEEVRHRVSDPDLVDAPRSAVTSAREAVADGWPRRRRASRWPWVAGVILGMTILSLMLLTPALRRWSASRRASGEPAGITDDVTPAPAMSAADERGGLVHPAEPHAMDAAPFAGRRNGVAEADVDAMSPSLQPLEE